MTEKLKFIISNLEDSFDGKPWYGIAVMKKLDEISWEITNQKIYGNKTIAILVKHIINWRVFIIKKLEGDVDFNIVIDGQNDWDAIQISSQMEWDDLKQELKKTQQNLLEKLVQENDALLLKKVPGKAYTFGPILTSIAQHDIYHLGQIAMLNAICQN
jgi:uncharacterized damage-inducible protein DinB